LLADRGALPARIPVRAGPRVCIAGRPAVQEREAEVEVIGVRGDGRLPGHGPLRCRARIDRIELAKQIRVAGVEHKRFLAGRTVEDLGQHIRKGALKDGIGRGGGGHRFLLDSGGLVFRRAARTYCLAKATKIASSGLIWCSGLSSSSIES